MDLNIELQQFIAQAGVTLARVFLGVGLIALFTLVAWRLLRLAANRVEKALNRPDADPNHAARLRTILKVGLNSTYAILGAVALLMTLNVVGLDITPLLAGLGVAGLALSLGAESLIKDMIAGVIILSENQFRVGDVIKVGAVTGAVENISLRATHIRDVEGKLNIIANGDIRSVANLTRDWAQAIVDFNIPYTQNIGVAFDALAGALQQTAAAEEFAPLLLEEPKIVGWNSLGDWGVQIRLMARTQPGQQWAVAAQLRQAGYTALQAAGVSISAPTALPVKPV